MYNRKHILGYVCVIIMLSLMIIPFISAIPPVQTTISQAGLEIAYPQYEYVKVNSNFTLLVHVYNATNYLTGNMANCYVDLYNPKGIEMCHLKMTAGSVEYSSPINNNFTMLGVHSFIIQCNSTSQTGFANGIFEVTNSGIELTTAKAFIDIGLLVILLVFFIIIIYIFTSFDNLLSKVGMLGLGYLLLIAIVFISWNMASDFLTSAPFVASMFNIIFIILMAGLFPLIIGGFAWYIVMAFKVKEIERLMDKGMDREEAEHRQGRKFKR